MSTTSCIPGFPFDKGKPFYPIVINYLAMLYGFKELAWRNIAALYNSGKISTVTLQVDFGPLDESFFQNLSNPGPIELSPVMDLGLTSGDRSVTPDITLVPAEIGESPDHLARWLGRSSGVMLILGYEVSSLRVKRDPLWNFLYHCRNGAAHDGRLKIQKGNPRFPAMWRELKINPMDSGKPLFQKMDGTGLLQTGDPIQLLWDIEQAYSDLKVWSEGDDDR